MKKHISKLFRVLGEKSDIKSQKAFEFQNARLNLLVCLFFVFCTATFSANAQTKLTSKVLLIPLDDRPPCLQFPVKIGLIGDVEVVTPPRELLGRFTEFGKSDEILKWIRLQNLKSFDAAIISMDMLAYGGLVASRVNETSTADALKRVEIVREIRRKSPKIKIYGSSVIMRLAPTGDGKNEAYRVNLAKWAEISSETDAESKAETIELEKKIPADALENYKLARLRNAKINLYSIELTRDKVLDYLILSQDDAKPKGVHIAEREMLNEFIKTNNLGEKVAVQPGADEVSMLLLARSMTDKYIYHPKIKAIYSDEKIADQFMPYEDRPLRKTVSFHIKAVGGIEVTDEKQADILFYVFVSRFEAGKAENFVKEIAKNIDGVKKIIVADVDPKGEIQGADIKFTEETRNIGFGRLAGYASWNTAGNTIGTALPHGIMFSVIQSKYGFPRKNWTLYPKEVEQRIQVLSRISLAQTWFMLNRLLDDYVYHSVVRPKAITFAKDKGWNVFRFDSEQTKVVEEFSSPKVSETTWLNLNSISPVFIPFAPRRICETVDKFSFTLPWGRTFEAEIDFKLSCKILDTPKYKLKKQ